MAEAKTTQPTNQPTEAEAEHKTAFQMLLELADTEAEAGGERPANSCRLYASGRINFTAGGYINTDTKYTAKIAGTTLLLYADKNAKRKTNTKSGSTDILYNLEADLRKREAYTEAVQNSKTDGSRCFKDYTITQVVEQDKSGADFTYYTIDLAEHQPKAEADTEADTEA